MSKKSAHDGKFKYTSEFFAKGALRHLVLEGKIKIGEMEPYKCPYCDGWHIGHPDPETQRLIREAITRKKAPTTFVKIERKPQVTDERWREKPKPKKKFVPPLVRMKQK